MTPHGNIPTIPIDRGTLQEDTRSPFLFTIFMEPILKWLSKDIKWYKPTHQSIRAIREPKSPTLTTDARTKLV